MVLGKLRRRWLGGGVILLLTGAFQLLSAQGLYGAKGVAPSTIRQGVLGSCYFHASVAALSQTSPNLLRSAIQSGGPGVYKVKFFDGPAETVFQGDIQYGREHGYDRSDGDWVLALMRAYAQRSVRAGLVKAIQSSTLIPDFVKPMTLSALDESPLVLVAYDRAIRAVVQQDGKLDQNAFKRSLQAQLSSLGVSSSVAETFIGFLDQHGFFAYLQDSVTQNGEVFGAYHAVGQGGIPERVLAAFLGAASSSYLEREQRLEEQLDLVHRGQKAMVVSTWQGAPPSDPQLANASWYVPNHAYTVLDYDAANRTVVVRNPWGAHPAPDGVFTLPLATLLRGFQVDYVGR